MSETEKTTIAVGHQYRDNAFHVVGLNQRGAIVLRQRWSQDQVKSRLANLPPCLMSALPPKADPRAITAGLESARGLNRSRGSVGRRATRVRVTRWERPVGGSEC